MTDEPIKPLRKLLPEQVAGEPYPVTIVATRYSGSYEGGRYAAFLTEPWDVPQDAFASDRIAYNWWKEHGGMIGVGDTPDEALESLKAKLR